MQNIRKFTIFYTTIKITVMITLTGANMVASSYSIRNIRLRQRPRVFRVAVNTYVPIFRGLY